MIRPMLIGVAVFLGVTGVMGILAPNWSAHLIYYEATSISSQAIDHWRTFCRVLAGISIFIAMASQGDAKELRRTTQVAFLSLIRISFCCPSQLANGILPSPPPPPPPHSHYFSLSILTHSELSHKSFNNMLTYYYFFHLPLTLFQLVNGLRYCGRHITALSELTFSANLTPSPLTQVLICPPISII